MDRRDLITLGGLFALGAAAEGFAQTPPAGGSAITEMLYVWSDAAGESHAEILKVAAGARPVDVTRMSIRPETNGVVDWHRPGRASFGITLTGEIEVEVTDGTKLKLPASGLAFLEDLTGKGHITRAKGAVNVFLTPPPGFDVRRWARGEA
jgi:hypothetical protein